MSRYANDGTYKCVCPRCGFYKYSDDMVREWTGLYVCQKCWEPRHPMDFFNVRPEDNNLPFTLPEGTHAETDTTSWVGVGETTPGGR